ncbi:hypothetical protein HDV05_000299 [Chytridiales sp. JEL 0842]|nr:hypothetical protein HDV05_000299 [Chytridiales sp. JEL 0842]
MATMMPSGTPSTSSPMRTHLSSSHDQLYPASVPRTTSLPGSTAGSPQTSRTNSRRPSGSGPGTSGEAEVFHQITDPQTGKMFYANLVTGECAWEPPASAIIRPQDPNVIEWWELFDEVHKLLTALQRSAIGRRVSVVVKRQSLQDGALPPNTSTSSDHNTTHIPKSVSSGAVGSAGSLSGSPQAKTGGTPLSSSRNFGSAGELRGSQNQMGMSGGGANKGSESAWRTAKMAGGISEPVLNPDAAAAMHPLANTNIAKASPAGSQSSVNRVPTVSNPNLASLPKAKPDKMLPSELLQHIRQFQMDGFAKKYFAEHRKGILRRKVPVEKMLVYSKDMIKTPLMTLPKNLQKDAIKCFKLIQRIMSDTSKGPPYPNTLKDVQSLMEKGIFQGGLRDEIYVQVCKQVNRNPSFDQTYRGWILLSALLIAFPPSKNFEDYLKSFINQFLEGAPIAWKSPQKPNAFNSSTTSSSNSGSGSNSGSSGKPLNVPEVKWAKSEKESATLAVLSTHCSKKLVRICKTGPRGKLPLPAEIERAQEAPFKDALFGVGLEEIMKTQMEKGGPAVQGLKVPRILVFLTEAIWELGGWKTEGIFRVPGDADAVNDLRVRLEKGQYDLTNIIDPNVPSSLLKLFLRELEDPLIPSQFYNDCISIGADENILLQQQQQQQQQHPQSPSPPHQPFLTPPQRALALLRSLPSPNKQVALFTLCFLQKITQPQYAPQTKMHVSNVAMVFAPNFLRCPSEDPQVIFESTKFEQGFLRVCLRDCGDLETVELD